MRGRRVMGVREENTCEKREKSIVGVGDKRKEL